MALRRCGAQRSSASVWLSPRVCEYGGLVLLWCAAAEQYKALLDSKTKQLAERQAPHRIAPHRTAPHRTASRRAARCACNAAHSSVQKTTCDGRQSWFAVAVSVPAACMLPVTRCMLPAVLCAVAWSWCIPMRCRLSLQGCARHATCLPSPVRATVGGTLNVPKPSGLAA